MCFTIELLIDLGKSDLKDRGLCSFIRFDNTLIVPPMYLIQQMQVNWDTHMEAEWWGSISLPCGGISRCVQLIIQILVWYAQISYLFSHILSLHYYFVIFFILQSIIWCISVLQLLISSLDCFQVILFHRLSSGLTTCRTIDYKPHPCVFQYFE